MIRKYSDVAALARVAADELTAFAHEAVTARGRFHLVLSGGSTPKALYAELASRGRAAAPWDHVELWWGDERCVPPAHPDSNFGAAQRALLEPLAIDPARVHRMRGEDDPVAAAAAYERDVLAQVGAPPVFDLVLLGMGGDGHTASLFPGAPQTTETTRYVVSGPGLNTTRLTMTARTINAARHVRFLVAGADKAETLAAVLQGPAGRYPAQLVDSADLVWLVDDAAAKHLKDRPS